MLCNDAVSPVNLNSRLQLLQPYPFEKLYRLFEGVVANPFLRPLDLSIGEPRHPTPLFIREVLNNGLDGFARYPSIAGSDRLREVIAGWLMQRYGLPQLDPATQVIATLGSREALFSLAQAVLDGARSDGLVLCPNPFYQIYEGAALLAGLQPYFINTLAEDGFRLDWSSVGAEVWRRVQLVFCCSPANPHGTVMTLDEWRELFELSDRYGFVIASDECYSEIYLDEDRAPLGALQAASRLGRDRFERLIVLGSLSKRSNVPGMRSGFAAGDASLIRQFTRYRTYHGSAMGGLIQSVSEAVWQDEAHVQENRQRYAEKFRYFYDRVHPLLPLQQPQASFYYWIKTPIDDREFATRLRREQNLTVLPGSLLAREAHGLNPGKDYVRLALVSTMQETREAAERFGHFVEQL